MPQGRLHLVVPALEARPLTVRILLVSQYFPPEIGAPQARLSELTRCWAATGDEVTVLTGMPNHPTGIVPPEYRGRCRIEEESDGYRIVRTWLYATPNEGVAKKTVSHLSFMLSAVLLGARRVGRPEVVVVSSPTFFSIFSAWVLARCRRTALVIEVRDLWPAIFVELGVITNRSVIRILEALELAFYRDADAVVVVSEGFRDDLVRRGIDPTKVHTIRNGVDLERFRPEAASATIRARLGAEPGHCLVLYVGAHGISHGLEAVAEAAAQLEGRPIHFAFVGEGAGKAALEARIRDLGITNATMLRGVGRDEVPGLLAAADICLVPLRDVPLFSSFIPSKIFEYFGAGKAVVGAVRGEPAAILRAGGAAVVEPEDPAGLARAIAELAVDPERRHEMGLRARSYVERYFDRRRLAEEYRALLSRVVATRDGRK